MLPRVYRQSDNGVEDKPGDLSRYLHELGRLLDDVHGTISARLDDTSLEACQPWLIPYFAELLDVRLLSPDVEGRRREVARAVAWRQRKGTLVCAEEIARDVGLFERTTRAGLVGTLSTVTLREAHRRVLTTPAIERPDHVQIAHLGTIDFRRLSRAEATESEGLDVRRTAFGVTGSQWQTVNATGVPCARDTYQDVSVRTVDTRSANHRVGHHHPHRLLVYSEPRCGFFPEHALRLTWSDLEGLLDPTAHFAEGEGRDEQHPRYGTWTIREKAVSHAGRAYVLTERAYEEGGRWSRLRLETQDSPVQGFEVAKFTSSTGETSFELIGVGEEPPRVSGGYTWGTTVFPDADETHIRGVVVDDALFMSGKRVYVRECAIESLVAARSEVVARDSLFRNLSTAADLRAQLEYCTVLGKLETPELDASDCILVDGDPSTFNHLALRYCCAPWSSPPSRFANTDRRPLFLEEHYGEPMAGVLHPAAPHVVRNGAEDGGEMGAYHHRHYVLREQAVVEKLRDFVPVTVQPVLIPHRAWRRPYVVTRTGGGTT
ncbi:MAG: hypothetical protein RIT81_47065 [Deltaproteobacteria bacterium]